MPTEKIKQLTAHLFRENSGKMIAVLSKIYGLHVLDEISDVVQDTFETALTKWKYGSIPDNPPAWLMSVAKNKAVNYFKRNSRLAPLDASQEVESNSETHEVYLENEVSDSQLRLLLTCCNPSFSKRNQILITLHILSGFGRKELANALLMEEEAVKKALTRTKKHLREKVVEMESRTLLQSEERIGVVHTVLYLMFNEGYKSTRSDQVINHDLCFESIRLTKLLLEPDTSLRYETFALLSIMFFALARFPARLNDTGDIITLEKQNRSLWDKKYINEGIFFLNKATKSQEVSKYHLEAIISSIHCLSPNFEETNWKQIVYLYEQLEKIEYSPLSQLNKIVAKSYVNGPAMALQELEATKQSGILNNHYLIYALEGDLLARLNKPNLAKRAFNKAQELSKNRREHEFLAVRIHEL
ncbi:RNA polymerase sigma factor [Fulvivirga lutea]|uniref:Sigma-70 family RNA polymerase sigma factor n=1 Tax=Fulvivirga lutea TaxID=2810512 RepID=A0A974WL58_9BACT|nr:sigma-70 family RNA polymerase sigma factor [Fulvivirga lutea]QSE99232.1 sigma-70 family RNA polymerase sigma factor [Fulvivirga lutea]